MGKALIVYYSMYGNTEKVAIAINEGLKSSGVDSNVVKVDIVNFDELSKVDLLCVGSPIQAWNISKPIREFIDHLKSVNNLKGKKGFAFDTKVKNRLSGDAKGKIEEKLKDLGFIIVRQSESGIVKGREGPLDEGTEEKFKQIGIELSKNL